MITTNNRSGGQAFIVIKRRLLLERAGLSAFALGSVFFVETATGSGDDIVIPYKKFVYDNGLTVLLHEDDSDPLVHVNITYHVGSAREEAQRSGFAHFFEHMMFQGSKNHDREYFGPLEKIGATLNGTTSTDRTNYFETVLTRGGGRYLLGKSLSYVDLSMFQVMASLNYAFPESMAGLRDKIARLNALHDLVAARPRIARYIASPARLPFSTHDLLRHYPELDA